MTHLVVMLSLSSGPAWGAIDGCADCASSLSLTRRQVECVTKRIDRLIGRPNEPVYFDASSCGQGVGTMTAAIPLMINPPAPAEHPDALWVQLTKRQLACLKARLGALPPSSPEPIVVTLDDASCSATKP